MNCELWQDKIDPFVDSELTSELEYGFQEHLRQCPACAAETVARQQLKAQTHIAGKRFEPSFVFRQKIEARLQRKPRFALRYWATISAGLLAAALLVVVLVRQPSAEQRYLAQLTDAYLAAQSGNSALQPLAAPSSEASPSQQKSGEASAESSSVKSWFTGKVPFMVDVPPLANTAFTLRGGQVVYLDRAPAAELVFTAHHRQISVFIFQEREQTKAFGNRSIPMERAGLQMESWTEDGLRYLALSNGNAEDVRRLCDLLKDAS